MRAKNDKREGTNRRQFLKTGGALAGAGLAAGCIGGGGGTPTPRVETRIVREEGGTVVKTVQVTVEPEQAFPADPLRLIIPYSTGGGYNYYSRLTAKYINQNGLLPEPVRPQNVTGGGGLVGANQMYNSDPDGYTFGIINTESFALTQAREVGEVRYDLADMTYYPNIAGKTPVIGVGQHVDVDGIDGFIEAMQNEELTIGHSGPGITGGGLEPLAIGVVSGEYDPSVVVNNEVRYEGKGDWLTGIKREEVDTMCGSFSSTLPFVESGDIKHVMVMTRDEDPPAESANADTFTDIDIDIDRTLGITGGPYHRPFVAPPDIPEERAETVRTAIREAIQDPALQEEAEAADRPISFKDSETTEAGIKGTLQVWQENQDLIEQIFGE